MFSFLDTLISNSPRENIISLLKLTPYDELMVIDLAAGAYKSLYHSDGKYFLPILDGTYRQLMEYVSANMVHPDDRDAQHTLMDSATMKNRLSKAEPKGILSDAIRVLWLDCQ